MADLYRGRLSPRRVACLIAVLPPDSATKRAIRTEADQWSLTDHLLAVVADRLAVISWQLGGNRHAPYPKPLVRPGVADPAIRHGRTGRRPSEVVAYLHQFAPKREEVMSDG